MYKDIMLLFDLDGTLWDSGEGVAAAWNKVLSEELPGRAPLSADDIHSVMGKTMDEISKIILPDLDEEIRSGIFSKCMEYENEYLTLRGGTLFFGVLSTLENLLKKGYNMAIVSNCQKGYIEAFETSMNTGRFFKDTEEWGRTKKFKAENIRLVMERNGFERGVYIGDTQGDSDSAKEAGIPFILASYGFGGRVRADFAINSFSELPAAVESVCKSCFWE